jgi:hypothetical protein
MEDGVTVALATVGFILRRIVLLSNPILTIFKNVFITCKFTGRCISGANDRITTEYRLFCCGP